MTVPTRINSSAPGLPVGLVAAFAGLLAGAQAACRLDPECFATDECGGEQICFRGACIDPPEPALADLGFGTGPGRDGGADGQYTWFRDVEPIVRVRCQPCHTDPPVQGAPFPLLEYADTQVVLPSGEAVYARMAARVADLADPMPPRTQPRLSPLEILILEEWADEGAPMGDRPDAGVDGGIRPDTGPDAGFVDTGFFDGGPMGAPDPLAQITASVPLPGAYVSLDGVAWSPRADALYFCDVGANLIFEYDPASGGTGPFRANTLGASGVGIDSAGSLIIAERLGRRVLRDFEGTPEVIANGYLGDRFNAPNDVEVRSDGTVYFTDPPLGLVGQRELPFNGIFRISTTGTVELEWAGAPGSSAPDGLALSPDERRLYVSDAEPGLIRVFDVATDGALTNPRGFVFTAARVGGMDTDRDGNLYVASEEGIEVFAPSGFKWGALAVSNTPTNVVFGGEGLGTLFAVTVSEVFAFPAGIGGATRPQGN